MNNVGVVSTDLVAAKLDFSSPAENLRTHMLESEYDTQMWQEMSDGEYVQAAMNSSWWTSLGLVIPPNATPEDLAVLSYASRSLHASDQWVRGDIVNWVRVNQFGGGDIPTENMVQLADMMGVGHPKKLKNAAATCAAWPLAHRYDARDLSFSHHTILNALPEDEKHAWAERCMAEGLTIMQLRTLLTLDEPITATIISAPVSQPTPVFASDVVDASAALEQIAMVIYDAGSGVHDIALALDMLISERVLKLSPAGCLKKWGKTVAQNGTASDED